MSKPMQQITEDAVINRLRSRISYTCKVKDLAAEFGVSAAFMSGVLAGKKKITEPMLKSIGVRRSVTYWLNGDAE